MGTVSDAIEAAQVMELQRKLPTIQGELDRMEEVLVSRVFKAIEAREFTQEQALYAWLELLSYRQLSRRLNTRVKVGQMAVQNMVNGASRPTEGGK